jgi:hypothetical protein
MNLNSHNFDEEHNASLLTTTKKIRFIFTKH